MTSKRKKKKKEEMLRDKACTGKRAHTNEVEAQEHAEHISRTDGSYIMDVYQCQFCGKWHMGH